MHAQRTGDRPSAGAVGLPLEHVAAASVTAATRVPRPTDRDPDQEVVLLQERIHSSSSRVPFVWIVLRTGRPVAAYFRFSSIGRRKKSRPDHRGLAALLRDHHLGGRGVVLKQLANMVSRGSPAIRNRLPGHSISFDRKKQ
jgi:hypothetical protein